MRLRITDRTNLTDPLTPTFESGLDRAVALLSALRRAEGGDDDVGSTAMRNFMGD